MSDGHFKARIYFKHRTIKITFKNLFLDGIKNEFNHDYLFSNLSEKSQHSNILIKNAFIRKKIINKILFYSNI